MGIFLKIIDGRYVQILSSILIIQITTAQRCNKIMINGQGVTEGDKNIILEYHNHLRQAIALGQLHGQPFAANMLQMNWDPDLARQAQKWANSCNNDFHDPRRNNGKFPVGQNIATKWTTIQPTHAWDMMADFGNSIREWFEENVSYRYGNSGYPSIKTGHFTQMIWAETNLIGCGFSFYYDPRRGYTKKYVCNYGPGGNVLEEYPYIKGRPACKRFNLLPSKKYEGLCVKSSDGDFSIHTNYIFG